MSIAKIKMATSLLLLVSVFSAIADSTDVKLELYPPGSGASRRIISSGELRLAVNDIDGRFTIGTIDGKSLLFGFPHEGATSHAHFFVNDSVAGTYTADGGVHPDPAVVTMHPTLSGESVVSRYDVCGVQFEQRLTITEIGERPSVLIEYLATNTTAVPANVGLLLFFDTMIGDNDFAPIATEYGYFAVEREFVAPDIPTYWQAFESSPWQPEDSLIGSGVLVGASAAPPDRIVFGDFWLLRNTDWEYTLSGDPFSDSAVLMRWDASYLMPGETRRMATYYGLGNVEIVIGDLNLSLSAPHELTIESCSFRTPNPFPVNLIVSNATGVILPGLFARLALPEGFHLADGYSSTVTILEILSPGASEAISWMVYSDDGYFPTDTVISLMVSAWSTATDTTIAEWPIIIPGIDGRGPSAELLAPSESSSIACDTVPLLIRIGESGEIDVTTLDLQIDGVRLTYPDPRLDYSGSFLRCWMPSAELDEGEVEISFGDVRDRHGCPLVSEYSWNIYLDWHPPIATILEPSAGDTVVVEDFAVAVDLDDLTGVEDTSLFWVIDEIDLDIPVSIVEGIASIKPMETGFIPLGFSEHRICLSGIHDKVYGYCGPNHAEPVCVDFWTNIERPYAHIIEPAPDSYSSCEFQRIVVRMVNPSGTLDPASIVLNVNGTDYSVGGGPLILLDSILIYAPELPYTDGSTIEASVSASTFSRMAIAPLSWTFHIDLSAPEAFVFSPAAGVFSAPDEPIGLSIGDLGAGVDFSSMVFDIQSPYSAFSLASGSPELHREGDSLRVFPAELGWSLHGGDTISVGIQAFDNARYCTPNYLDRSFEFVVPATPPVYGPPSITELTFVSCETLRVSFALTDEEGLDLSSIIIHLNSVETAFGTPAAYLDGDSVRFNLPWPLDSDTIMISLGGIADIFGNEVGHSIKLSYFHDSDPPIIASLSPDPSELNSEFPEAFIFEVFDSASGLNLEECFVSLGGVRVDLTSGLLFEEGRITAPTAAISPFDRDSLRVCLHSADLAEVCGANTDFSCWVYRFDFDMPTVEIVSPPPNSIVGCSEGAFIFRLHDDQGIDPSSIVLRARDREYTLSDDALNFDGETLEFYFDDEALHGVACSVAVIAVSDSSGNSISAPVGGLFAFDFEPPIVQMVSPDSALYGPIQRIEWRIEDSPAGVLRESIALSVNGVLYSLDSPALSFDGARLVFDPRLAQSWNEVAEIELSLRDSAPDCPNSLEIDYTLLYMPALPRIEIISPAANCAVACDSVEVEASIDSRFGLDLSGASVSCGGYTALSEDLVVSEGRLNTFLHAAVILQGNLTLEVTGLKDTLGNEFEFVARDFLLDTEPPEIDRVYPDEGGNAIAEHLIISARVADEISGLNLDMLKLWINDTVYHLDSPILQLLGDSLALDASSLNLCGQVSARIEAFDKTTDCGPNISTESWDFYINRGGPSFELLEPIDGSITHDPEQKIRIRITDTEGVNANSISMNLNGEVFPFSGSMNFTGDILEFRPNEYWETATIYDITIYCEDSLDNSSNSTIGTFVTDFDAPRIVSSSPIQDAVLKDVPESIILFIEDEFSGFDPASFQIEYRGGIFSPADEWVFADSSKIVIDVAGAMMNLTSPDSILLKITGIADFAGDYGAPNIAEDFYLAFTIVDDGCVATPRPFTPNADGFYDEVTIFTGVPEISTVRIFSKEGRPVRSASVRGKWNWDGADDAGSRMPQGIYMFTITRDFDGAVQCGGTVILAR